MLNIYEFNSADTITVEVTHADIANGVRANCGRCPVANALRRMFPQVDSIQVNTLELVLQNLWADDVYYVCPPEARVFINRFDAGYWTEPFTFTAVRV